MSDLEALYLILAVIYLVQCIVWVPEDSLCFRKTLRGEWRSVSGWLHIGAWRLRGVLASPLPPLEGVVVCDAMPLAVSPLGVLPSSQASLHSAAKVSAPLQLLRFDELEKLRAAGKQVFSGSKLLCKLPTSGIARHAAELLEALRSKKESKRAAAMEAHFARTLDAEQVRACLADLRTRSTYLRWLCNALFIYLFVLAPVVITFRGLLGTWLWLLAPLLAQMAVMAWLFRRAHRALFPADRDTRWISTLTIVLSPPVAIRANDVLLRELLCRFHPLAVARVLCSKKYFLEMASRALRELAFPLPSTVAAGTPAQETEDWFRNTLYRSVQRFVAASGGDPENLLGPPPRESPQCLSYCPRCWNQYRFPDGTCPDCGGVEVRRFSEAGDSEPAAPEN